MFPTRVGMNRMNKLEAMYAARVPHTRGDEPPKQEDLVILVQCSPHAWG